MLMCADSDWVRVRMRVVPVGDRRHMVPPPVIPLPSALGLLMEAIMVFGGLGRLALHKQFQFTHISFMIVRE